MGNLSLLCTKYFLSVGAYLVGAIPTGYWFAKYFFDIDITQHGSGNIGATNISRVLGSKKYFFVIFLIDALKAYSYIIFVSYCFSISWYQYYFIAFALLMGNAYSIFLNYRGGKGVATAIGILSAIAPTAQVIIFVMSWFVVLIVTRLAVLASLFALLIMFTSYVLMSASVVPGLSLFLCFLFFWFLLRHRSNIEQLLRG